MSNIVCKDEAVFYANNTQFRKNDRGFQRYNDTLESWQRTIDGDELEETLNYNDFQLNEIRQGDYIEASELDTEQKYNDAVAVFELFGGIPYDSQALEKIRFNYDSKNERKITYTQLMAIGKLKRAMIERDEVSPTKVYEDWHASQKQIKEFYGEPSNPSRLPNSPELNSSDFESSAIGVSNGWSDKHYNYFYQLSEEDIKAGKIKVDAYFVNRMWKINSWEDTGAGFHILKTFPRIANNKNSLKRELVALKKQVDILCKLHGVDDEDLK